jgi:hypothetical protein
MRGRECLCSGGMVLAGVAMGGPGHPHWPAHEGGWWLPVGERLLLGWSPASPMRRAGTFVRMRAREGEKVS